MNPMLQQFTAVALPIILALAGAAWLQNRRLDDIIARLGRIEAKLDDHAERIVKLEVQTSPITRRG
jgi:hypothetical protein